jgi:hypothetical protein
MMQTATQKSPILIVLVDPVTFYHQNLFIALTASTLCFKISRDHLKNIHRKINRLFSLGTGIGQRLPN